MKMRCTKMAITAASLFLAANLACAVELKVATPDLKGAVRTTGVNAKSTAKGAMFDTRSVAKARLIDINTASEAELKAVPGFGNAYAVKIIAGRPYAKKDQLKSRKILPVTVYEKTKDLIIARQPIKNPAKPAADKKK